MSHLPCLIKSSRVKSAPVQLTSTLLRGQFRLHSNERLDTPGYMFQLVCGAWHPGRLVSEYGIYIEVRKTAQNGLLGNGSTKGGRYGIHMALHTQPAHKWIHHTTIQHTSRATHPTGTHVDPTHKSRYTPNWHTSRSNTQVALHTQLALMWIHHTSHATHPTSRATHINIT